MGLDNRFTAGDTQSWTDASFLLENDVTASPSTHTLTTSLRGPIAAAGLDLPAISTGGAWVTTLASAGSMALNPTNKALAWFWQATVIAIIGGARTTVASGQATVLPNLAGLAAGSTVYDGRSTTEQDLAAVRAEISARLSGGATLEYTIGTRSLKKEPMNALIMMETRLKATIARQKTAQSIANGLGNPGRVQVRFRR